MILRIARHEVRTAFRDGAALLLLLGQLGLLVAALLVRWPGYSAVREEKREAAQSLRSLWVDQGPRHPHAAGHQGTTLVKPLPPLSLLNPGIDAYTGQWVRLETHRQNEPMRRPAEDRGPGRRFGELSVFFVLVYLLPLGVFVIGAQSLSRENAAGTLAMLLAQGVTPLRLLLGKALGLLVLFSPQMLVLSAVALLLPGVAPEFAGAPSAALAILIAALSVYLAVLVLASLAASGLAPGGGAATMALVGLWLLGALVLPRAVSSTAEAVERTPSSFEFRRAYDLGMGDNYVLGYGGAAAFNEVFERVKQRLMQEHGVARAEDLPVNPFGYAIDETEEMGQHAYDASFGTLAAAFERQEGWRRLSAWLSPIAAFRSLSDGLSGTDHAAHLRFVREAEGYRREMMRTLNMDVAGQPDPAYSIRTRGLGEYVRGRDLWERVPAFQPAPPTVRSLAASQLTEFVALLAWLLATALASVAGARRICGRA